MTNTTMTMGIDLGDKYSHACVLDAGGKVAERARLRTTPEGVVRWFAGRATMCVAIETGTHTRWVAELLREQGHEVLVANARQVRLVYAGPRKNDQLDAEKLARLARADPQLLNPVSLRSRRTQADRAIVIARDTLIGVRTMLINGVKGTLKSFGRRVRSGDADAFHRRVLEAVPLELMPALEPLIKTIEHTTAQIRAYNKIIDAKIEEHPAAKQMMQIHGVGPITSLAYVLTLEDPKRFARSRDVGP